MAIIKIFIPNAHSVQCISPRCLLRENTVSKPQGEMEDDQNMTRMDHKPGSTIFVLMPKGVSAPEKRRNQNGLGKLTPREWEVLKLIGEGVDNSTIAQRLRISKRTVETYVYHIYSKLDLNGRVEAMLYAVERGLVEG